MENPIKRVYPTEGEASAEERALLEHALAQLDAGAGRRVYPILKAHDWPAREHAVSEPFAGHDEAPFPRIAYGYNTDDAFVFITTADLGKRGIDDLRKEAMANLSTIDVTWVRASDGVLRGSRSDFSAEKILDPRFIREAEKLLGSDQIFVAIPRRTLILAIDARRPQAKVEAFFEQVARALVEEEDHAPITSFVFKYEGVEVVGGTNIKL